MYEQYKQSLGSTYALEFFCDLEQIKIYIDSHRQGPKVLLIESASLENIFINGVQEIRTFFPKAEYVFISETEQFLDAILAFKTGAFAYLTEPYSTSFLKKNIEEAYSTFQIFQALETQLNTSIKRENKIKIDIKNVLQQLIKKRCSGNILNLNEILESTEDNKELALILAKDTLFQITNKTEKKHILIVEDDETIAENLQYILEEQFHVFTAGSAKELEALEIKAKVDLIILDVYLPDATAQELIPGLLTKHRNAKILVMTAYQELQIAEECFRLGAVEFLNKPFPTIYVLNAISKVLQKEYMKNLLIQLEKWDGIKLASLEQPRSSKALYP